MPENFGEYLKSLRKGQTRKSIAEKAGISAEYLRQIEDKGQIPKEDKLLALAEVLRVEPRDLLTRAIIEKNKGEDVIEQLSKAVPAFPLARKVLLAALTGEGADLVKRNIAGVELSLPEMAALSLWSGIYYMDRHEMEVYTARAKSRESINDKSFIEKKLAKYIARLLVSWQVDPENGRQVHAANKNRIQALLKRMAIHLGQVPDDGSAGDREVALIFAELLEDPDFEVLCYNLRRFKELGEEDKIELKAWWRVVNKMVEERLSRDKERKGT